MLLGNGLFEVGTVGAPARAGHLVGVAVVAVFHHVVDPHTLVAVVVVVALPEGTIRVDGHLEVVTEILAQHLHFAAVGVTTEHHALPVALFVDGFARVSVENSLAVFILNLLAFVAEVEVPLAIGAKDKGVHAVVVLIAAEAGKQDLFLVGFVVAVGIGKHPDVGAIRNDGFVALHPDAQRRLQFWPLIKHLAHVGFAVAVLVFQNHHAVAGGVGRVAVDGGAVVIGFAHPHPPTRIDVDIGGVHQHRFGGKQRGVQVGGYLKAGHGVFWVVLIVVGKGGEVAVQERG